jgi:hypothetical protein
MSRIPLLVAGQICHGIQEARGVVIEEADTEIAGVAEKTPDAPRPVVVVNYEADIRTGR